MPALPAPGDRLAGFLLERELGHGATGVVFLATEEALGRRVALKVVGPPLAHDPAFRWRFLREARTAAALDHPNVVTVLQHGDDEDRLWLAMRLVDGPDLRVLLRRTGSLDPEQAVEIVEQVAAALDAAHAAGLVHRDVKPGNVLVEDRPGRRMHAELADFGLADAAGRAPWAARPTTVRPPAVGGAFASLGGRIVGAPHPPSAGGTPGYAAPEQLRGAEPTVAADVHALGCVLYEALTGVAPAPVAVAAGGGAASGDEPGPGPGPATGAAALGGGRRSGGATTRGTTAGDEPGLGDTWCAGARERPAAQVGRATGLRPSAAAPRLGIAFDAVVAAATDPDPAARPSTAGAVARAARAALGHAAASRAAVARAAVRPATPAEVAAGAAAVGAGVRETGTGGAGAATVGAHTLHAAAAGRPAPTLGAATTDPHHEAPAAGAVRGAAPVTREALWRAPARRARWTVPLAAGGLLVVLGGAYAAVDRAGVRPTADRAASPASTPLRADASRGTTKPATTAGDGRPGATAATRPGDADGPIPGTTGATSPPAGATDVPEATTSPAAGAAPRAAAAADDRPAAHPSPQAPTVGGRAPYAAATPPAAPVPDGYRRFGGGSWTLDLPAAAGWRQTATQELEGGARVLTRLRRADGARLVVEHLPGRTAVLGPAAGDAFSVRLPRLGRARGGVFTGGRYAMCRTGLCAAIPANGASGGVLLVAATPDARAARRLAVAAARHVRVG